MPKADGLSLVKFSREKSPQPTTPLTMVTSNGQLNDVMESIHAGVNDYLVKPFEFLILQDKVRNLLDKH
jgi:two-component system chemotaxis response regulator CheY